MPVSACALPATWFAAQSLTLNYFLMTLPALYLPTAYYIFDAVRVNIASKQRARSIWLYDNGD